MSGSGKAGKAGQRARTVGRLLWFLSISRNALCIVIASGVAKAFDVYTDGPPFAIVGEPCGYRTPMS